MGLFRSVLPSFLFPFLGKATMPLDRTHFLGHYPRPSFLPVPPHSHGVAGDKKPPGRLPDAPTFPLHRRDLELQHELPLLGRQGVKLW